MPRMSPTNAPSTPTAVDEDEENEGGVVDLHEEWEAEIERRIEDVRAGRAELIPAREVFAEMDADIARRARERAARSR